MGLDMDLIQKFYLYSHGNDKLISNYRFYSHIKISNFSLLIRFHSFNSNFIIQYLVFHFQIAGSAPLLDSHIKTYIGYILHQANGTQIFESTLLCQQSSSFSYQFATLSLTCFCLGVSWYLGPMSFMFQHSNQRYQLFSLYHKFQLT